MLEIMTGEMTRVEVQAALGLKGRANFEERYLKPAMEMGLVGMTIPDKPPQQQAEIPSHSKRQDCAGRV